MMKAHKDVESYIKDYPKEVQVLLKQMRSTLKKAAPKTEEAIRYGIPTLRVNGKNLVHYGAFKDHLSFFPGPSGISAFKKELKPYKVSKGTIQFPLDTKLPLTLVTKIVKLRLTQSSVSKKRK
jgi:uncharacterized protein YdhG (YjbR/CyaY superfamily)